MPDQPNVLIIQPDQHRHDCLGIGGNPLAVTPAIDGLARGGVRFTHAFTPVPTCCPSRQSLLCGRWPQTHGGLWNYGTGLPMALFDQPTWTEALAAQGYALGYVGKWEVHPTRGPLEFGFHEHVNARDYAAWRKAEDLSDYQRDADRLAILQDKPVTRWFGGIDPAPLEATRTHWYADRAMDYIRRYSAEGRPWHVRLDFEEPHLPCFPAEPFASRIAPGDIPPWGSFGETFQGKPYIQQQQLYSWGIEALTWSEWSVFVARYLAMLSQVDDAIGRVLALLDELGQAENTLVICTTDHGDNTGSHRLIDKHYIMYDDVVRVPLVVRWPQCFPAGQTRDEFVIHALDLASTVCEATGLPVPAEYEGRSLLPLCCGEQAPDWRQDVLAVYNGAQFGVFMQRMLRDRRWKYVWNPTDVDELYDLQRDPWELHNRIGDPACAEALSDLRRRLLAQLIAQGDALVRTDWTRVQLSEGRKLVR
jgi:arylsulfatase A-like enzyme